MLNESLVNFCSQDEPRWFTFNYSVFNQLFLWIAKKYEGLMTRWFLKLVLDFSPIVEKEKRLLYLSGKDIWGILCVISEEAVILGSLSLVLKVPSPVDHVLGLHHTEILFRTTLWTFLPSTCDVSLCLLQGFTCLMFNPSPVTNYVSLVLCLYKSSQCLA